MKKKDFERAPLKEKVYKVFEGGKAITDRRFLYFQIRLFALNDFFVEVWYVPSTNKIDRVETLGINEVLAVYDSRFDISQLL